MAVAGRPTIFISYKRGHETSLALIAQLEAALVDQYQVLRDVNLEVGGRWSEELWGWLLHCSGAVAVISDEAAESDWCRREWSVLAAREAQASLRVVPVHVGSVGPQANILEHLQAVTDGSDVVDRIVERLLDLPAAPMRSADYMAAHTAWLRRLYKDSPALGREPFSLADVYVDTECGALIWAELSSDRTIDPFAEQNGGRDDLVETVLDYLGHPKFRDLVVVQGPAGSGKSAFTLRLANRLADEGLVPMLVRFRDLRLSTYDDLDDLLKDALRVAPVDEHPPVPDESLLSPSQLARTTSFRGVEICSTVVILDGWDEVATGTTRFKNQIEQWLPRLRERFTARTGPPVRLVLTGRPSSAVESSTVLRKQTPVLTIRPLRPQELRRYAVLISDKLRSTDEWVLDLDRCERAFASYEAWFDHRGDTGTDVLGSPLLALLAFRTLAERPGGTDELFAQPTALYKALIDITTEHAGKAEDSPEGTVHRRGRSLRRLLQRVASVITAHGSETVSFEELRLRLEDDGALVEWANEAAGDGTLHELVVNFYFKGHAELGCEFLHKSFREYLFAESIVAALEAVSGGRAGSHEPPQRGDSDFELDSPYYDASRALARLLAPQWLTPEVRTHTFWLIDAAISADPERWVWVRGLLCDIYAWWVNRTHLRMHAEPWGGSQHWHPPPIVEMLKDGIPVDGQSVTTSKSTTRVDAVLGHAILQLTAHVHVRLLDHASAGSRVHQSMTSGLVRFRPFAESGYNVVARITSSDPPHGAGLTFAYIKGVDLEGANLQGANLKGTDLEGANLREAELDGANLREANLDGANLEGASLQGASLQGAKLRGANLMGTDLEGANLQRTSIEAANLKAANLQRAHLGGAHLERADLGGAHLGAAHLERANFEEANLMEANLTEANLTETNLTGADLRGAHLEGANLRKTNLRGANLGAAHLERANLGAADLGGLDLRGAHLEGANLRGADLHAAHLEGADLGAAHLGKANLRGVHLEGANLKEARLEGADLWGAHLEGANLRGADLHAAHLDAGGKRAIRLARRRR